MSLFSRILPPKGPERPELHLSVVIKHLRERVGRLKDRPVDHELVRARVADAYRQVELRPISPSDFDSLVADLDDEAWRRLALVVSVLDEPQVRELLPRLLPVRDVVMQVRTGMVGLARSTNALTLDLLQQSEVRVEEFARQFAARMGAGIVGESEDESAAQLYKLDYTRLLAEAEQARTAAEERVEYLRKLQQRQQPRRGS